MAVRLRQFLQLAAEMCLFVASKVLMFVGRVQGGEMQIALSTGYI